MELNFRKYHGTGNDFILVNALASGEIPVSKKDVVRLCARHFGIGADGILVLLPSDIADYKMRIFNSDGSEPEMCGNGVRCFVHYLYDLGLIEGEHVSVETLGGVKEAHYFRQNQKFFVEVSMGEAHFKADDLFKQSYTQEKISNNEAFTAVSMGNPHMIILKDEKVSLEYLTQRGKELVANTYFPQGTNVEFIALNEANEVDMMVYERGAGITLACGTGACASVAALKKLGKVPFNTWVKVHLLGGDLEILVKENYADVLLKGEAAFVFSGTITL